MGKLQSKGNIDIRNAIGKEGTVYLNITPPERGKVEINIQDRLRIVDAVVKTNEPIPTGERVIVTEILDSGVLVVERVSVEKAS